ncbi:MAG: ammonium transporter [bacterium]|jgi:Amt family ammonium transporter|uniref:Ammonium transporter n=1 Tax=Microcystis flos-aquae FACHB-1344 TaxID=2692899 RepID=A0ABR8HUG4_9CHRO|nr:MULTISPECIES: ammonium transporter [Microcystis]MBD2623148.1 ammonium transporter [Microcystis flos-aquae FACHB-1344]MCA2701520.1 ammonium transporter [Microcystis sp. M179S2]
MTKKTAYHLNTPIIIPTIACLAILLILVIAEISVAQTATSDNSEALYRELRVKIDTLWVIFTACLVFFMNAGFAMLESGFCRSKNTVNILTKNLIVFALTTIAFWSFGFGLMFSQGNGFVGLSGFFVLGADNSPNTGLNYLGIFPSLSWAGIPLQAKFFFQLVFAGTAATIVSGAVAERIKFLAFFLFSLLLVAFIYPITGHWIWGGGWLARLNFWDFAGSTVVHTVGGWASLVGAVLLGPRLGKYQGSNSMALPGHNLTLSTLGCFILWLGWFGFNPGSTLAMEPEAISRILLNTNMAAATGGIAATLTAWRYFGKPDLSVIINGILGGLVAITAACPYVQIGWAAIIGMISGILVVLSVDFFDRLQIDDPVGALSVHLVCGLWGTFAVALFAAGIEANFYSQGPVRGLLLGGGLPAIKQLFVQLLGCAAVSLYTVIVSWSAWKAIDFFVGLRVSTAAELRGLDLSEHGLQAYSGFLFKSDLAHKISAIIPKRTGIPPKDRGADK